MTRSALAARIRVLTAGMKQKDLAARMGVSAQYVNDLLHGKRNIPPLALDKFVNAIGNLTPTQVKALHRVGAIENGWRI